MHRILAALLPALIGAACFGAPGYTVTSASLFGFTPVSAPTVLALGDNELSSPQSPAGFSFTYFGQAFSSFHVGSNGYLIMGAQGTTTAMQPSHADAPGCVISPFWGDLRPNLQGQIGWSFGAGKLTVEYLGVRLASAAAQGGPYNVQIQIVLDTASGVIEFFYGDHGGFGIGPGSAWDFTCAISGPSGPGQAIVPGSDGSFISPTGKVSLWPLLRTVKFTPIPTTNNVPVISVSANGAPLINGGTLDAAYSSPLATLGISIEVDDPDANPTSVAGSITSVGSTGLLASEFSSNAAGVPYQIAPQSGVFNASRAVHQVTLVALDGHGGQAVFTFSIAVSAAPGDLGGASGGGGACTAGGEAAALPVLGFLLLALPWLLRGRSVQI